MAKKRKIGMWIILVLLLILTGINIYNLSTVNVHREVSVLQAAGEENWEKLQKAFSSEKFQKTQKENFEKIKQNFQEMPEIDPDAPSDESSSDNLKETTADGNPALDAYTKIKGDAFVYGDNDARFTIIEYSELVCPFCKRHSNDGTLNKVLEQLPEDVNIIHRSYLVHPSAQKLQEGWLCARDQLDGEEHLTFIEKLFEEDSLTQERMLQIAKEIGYDTDMLSTCIQEGKYAQLLNEQTAEGRNFGITGTPGHVVFDTKTWKYTTVWGAFPVSKFINTINSMRTVE